MWLDCMEAERRHCPKRLSCESSLQTLLLLLKVKWQMKHCVPAVVKRLRLTHEGRLMYHMHVMTMEGMLEEFNSITQEARRQGLLL